MTAVAAHRDDPPSGDGKVQPNASSPEPLALILQTATLLFANAETTERTLASANRTPTMRRLIFAPLFVSTLVLAQGRSTDHPAPDGPDKFKNPRLIEVRALPVNTSVEREPEPEVFSLAGAIAIARQHSPRLRSARAAIERARGEERAAFAPFLPRFDLLFQSGATSNNEGPATTGPTGFILTSGTPGTHAYAQTELQLLWTLYDFGRRTGRHNQAAARERIAELQLVRADQTVQFEATAAYLSILLARASLLVQEDAIRQAEATLKDARARLRGGVAEPNDVLRAEVQLSESRDAAVNARKAESVAIAQLNNVMGRDASLPLRVLEVNFPPLERRPSLAESIEIAAAQRPEIRFARQAVVAAQEGLVSAKAAFLPRIYVRASTGRVDGAHIMTGWQAGAGLHVDVPLYTGGLLGGELHTAESEVAAAMADAQIILDTIGLEVNRAFQSELAAQQRIELSRPAVVQAQENLRLMRVRYLNGDATPTDIVDAETALTRSRQRLNSAIYTYLAALAGLDYAMGREQRPRGSP